MELIDILYVIKWWLVFFVIGLIFLPLTVRIFSNFFDKGYIFARILGMALISYVVFVLGVLKLLPFTTQTILFVTGISIAINIFIFLKDTPSRRSILIKSSWKLFFFEEIIFISTLFFWSYIRAHEPSIHGLEKYMDFGFVNSIIRSEHFPPRDMWFTPHSINYYYFGHLVTAVLTKLSGIPSSITYNLMLSAIFALTFTGAFSIGLNLFNTFLATTEAQKKNETQKNKFSASRIFGVSVVAGLLSGFLASMAGNLHAIYTFFKPYVNENPVPFWQLAFSFNTFPNSYWYPNATRFIHNTIHEFPIYSFVVSDLHGHFIDIPFVLLTIAILLSLIFKSQISNPKSQINSKSQFQKKSSFLNFGNWGLFRISNLGFRILLLAFMLAIMYMTNAWDGIIYFLLTAIVIVYIKLRLAGSIKNKNYILHTTYYILLVLIGSILFSLPFSINFKPFASGIGVLCAPEFLTNIGKLGPFLFEKDHCLRSPIWQLAILYGFFYFFVIVFIVSILPKIKMPQNKRLTLVFKSLAISDIFILFLIILSTLLIIIPEFIYVKDIYPGHYRANTMFKLVYQSFIMLSIASAYIAVRLISNFKYQISKTQIKNKIFNFYYVYLIFAILFLILVMIYPYFAINSYYNLRTYQGLDGIKYLKPLYPTDYEGILWINKNIKGQPVILEAQGDSYTDYARISSNTGLPTVLGWTVHEWLWRGTYDIPSPRIPEVQTLYEIEDIQDTKKLIDKYNLQLVFIGDLERKKYPKLNEEKFKTLGKVIYQNGDTKIYKISN